MFDSEEAPICQGRLRGDFGYLSISPIAKAILNGSYVYPADFDEDTKAICRECARIRTLIPIDSVSFEINEDVSRKNGGEVLKFIGDGLLAVFQEECANKDGKHAIFRKGSCRRNAIFLV